MDHLQDSFVSGSPSNPTLLSSHIFLMEVGWINGYLDTGIEWRWLGRAWWQCEFLKQPKKNVHGTLKNGSQKTKPNEYNIWGTFCICKKLGQY